MLTFDHSRTNGYHETKLGLFSCLHSEEKIDFNQAYWEKIKSNLVWFYEKYLVAA